ncbi:NAD(P)/FAD-dependent oxidoreductase [Pelovirga terrestris]|uniref:FAD-dependent oxidoreductase n=1 Tax=Pelovirga terrestris TaxID=2771352 RepID=A0A8J6QQ51_9BACT|nr:FAD-dependent oxidoreductase [Pelovirga terrestris]MBD1400901.1 FAD-dependent oxidoreductase [Pelovirga terrestris]
MAQVVVLGGGYAGLASLISLAKKMPALQLHLIDANPEHCKITNLHKTFARQVADFKLPYTQLAERFGFTFHQHRLQIDNHSLNRWQQQKKIPLGDSELDFDWLIISTGAAALVPPRGRQVYGLEHLMAGRGPDLLEEWRTRAESQRLDLSFVGGGATGLQILFELKALLRQQKIDAGLRLIDMNSRTLPMMPEGAHRYVVRKLRRENIIYLPQTEYLEQTDTSIKLRECGSDREYQLDSAATLLFAGVKRAPISLPTNPFGQIELEGNLLPDIFSAGDCSDYAGNGLNQLTAQAAVRKGKLVAHNIVNLYAGRRLRPYRYQEKGYLMSLGPIDAVGWVGLHCNLARGFPANILKEAMESQYDLFLDGVDTYLGFP